MQQADYYFKMRLESSSAVRQEQQAELLLKDKVKNESDNPLALSDRRSKLNYCSIIRLEMFNIIVSEVFIKNVIFSMLLMII
jgi:hypothetical protein